MTRRLVILAAIAVVFSVFATLVLAADMFSGTWKVNIAKSTYSPGPAPKGPNIAKIQGVDNGLKVTIDNVNDSGQKTHTEYTVKFDGKDYPNMATIDGKPDPNAADMISAKKIDDYTYETTTKLKGKVLVTSRSVVAKDGKSRTITQTGKNAQGQTVNNKILAEKQ